MSLEEATHSSRKIHPALQRSLWARVIAYALGCPLVYTLLPPDSTWIRWVVLFFGLVYPALFSILGSRASNTRAVGFAGYYIDALLWGLAVVATHYAIVMLAVAPLLAVVTGVLMLGLRRGSASLAVLFAVVLSGPYFVDVELTENFLIIQAVYGWTLILVFMLYITLLVNATTRNFVSARHQLEEKNLQVMEQADQLESMSKVAQLVNSTLDIDEVMNTIAGRLNRIFEFSIMAILFLDREKQSLCLDRISGNIPDEDLQQLQGMHIPLSEKNSAFSITANSRAPRYLADVSQDRGAFEGVSGAIFKLVPARSLLTFPLIQDEEVQGVLAFANTDNFFLLDDADIEHIGLYVTYVVSALRNASDYREIQEARAAADAANKAKSQFLANMSHELRTPMNAVIGYSEMLEEEAEEQGLDDFIPDLQKIRSASQHLLQLINDVLDLSKIEADKVELYPELFRADSLLMDVEATAKPLLDKNANRFERELLNDLGEVLIDQTRMRQILLNLLSNAAKFTNKGVIRLTAERSTQGYDDWITFRVTDSGIGMTAEQLERVFDPFSQADASTTREFGGTGLGLSISRKFCEMMGGTLTADSEKGEGSTFTIRVPTGTARKPQTGPTQDRSENTHSGKNNGCVLVIDDDEHVQEIMQRMLSREGYKVVSATDGITGVALAREIRPDVITLDVLMPGQDGWSVLNQLKNDPELADIPVVMQSILDETNKAFSLGASDYLTKPVDRSRLVKVIRRLQRQDNRRVLVVEDDVDTQMIMTKWLRDEGWEVHSAVNGLEGVQAFLKHNPGLIILDLMMPTMDGFEFLDQIRRQPNEVDASVVVVTAKDLTGEDLERLNGSVQSIIQKGDHGIDSILNEIKRLL
jgi:signal transduction histidine kinase/CheY-like chemotaxis protein